MKPVLLIDFGSTYTKTTCVDVASARILGTAQSYTTVETDVGEGLENALRELRAQTGISEFVERYACSSAAGGLRMIASGLVPTLTTEAAKRAALGAGAKVIRTYCYEMTEDDLEEIRALSPDILLLCGGTDGGNRDCIERNAKAVASLKPSFPIVLAGNRAAAGSCRRALEAAGAEVIQCENVMPAFNTLNVAPCQKAIREVFLRRIVSAKGLTKASELISGILMPTPAAVLTALTLFAENFGELAAVDLGGATTDVYSIAKGLPSRAGTVLRGLPEPYAKRTVEGDIGMRYSAHGVADAAGVPRIAAAAETSEAAVEAWLARVRETPGVLAETEEEKAMDFALASLAIETGLTRHSGSIEEVFTPMGLAFQQTGKDLTQVKHLLLTGGALIHTGRAEEMAARAMAAVPPQSLAPREARIILDRHYILSAMGLLSQKYQETAREIMGREFL